MSAGQPRRWGYHRLRPDLAEKIVAAAAIRPGQLVIDLGAGDGALTVPLLDAGARVIAVELHAARAERLRSRVADRPCAVVTLDLTEFTFPRRPCRVVANPPFTQAAALLRQLDRSTQVFAVDLVLPRWLVRRYLHSRDRSGRHRAGWRAVESLVLAPTAFLPAAASSCALLQLRRRPR